MAVRPIDANAMLSELRPVSFEAEHSAVLLSDVSKMMREWVERQPTLTPPNEPLTIEELREMNGEPAWWDDGDGSCWGIISVDSRGMWGGIPFFRGRWREVNFEYNIEERKMKIYRRPPEGEEDAQ